MFSADPTTATSFSVSDGRVFGHHLAVFRPQLEHVFEIVPDQRPRVRVRRTKHQLRPIDSVLLLNACRDNIGDAARQPDQIGRDNDHPFALAILNRQRFRPQIVDDALRRMIAAAVAGHVNRFVRRNDDAPHPGLVIRRAERGTEREAQHRNL